MLPTTHELPASRTHAERRCHWSPSSRTLTICQGRNTKDHQSYAVEELEAGPGVRAFLLSRTEGEDVIAYLVTVGPDRSGCTCDGFRFTKKFCKHLTSLVALLEAGDLDAAGEG